jgi:tetratricopeptide (TPR) repeat protein
MEDDLMQAVRPWLILGLATLLGCAHVPLGSPERGGHRWIEARSLHFTLRTDLSPRQARGALREFETTYAILENLGFPSLLPLRKKAAPQRIDLVLFRSEADFQALAPPGAAGYYTPHLNNHVDPRPTIVLHGELTPESQRRFQHELTHRFLGTRVRRAPPWVEEGLADFYSTLRSHQSVLYLGELPVRKLLVTEIRSFIGLLDRFIEYRIRASELPSLGELLQANEHTFHRPASEAAFYAASWALVHMLHLGPQNYRPRFEAYLADLGAGVPADTAWQRRFGDIPGQRLEREFAEYVQRTEMPFQRLVYAPPRLPVERATRQLPSAEVHVLWARIRPWDSRENILRAGQDLRAAVALAPNDPEVRYWLSFYHRRWRRFGEAEADLRQALVARPREPRYWHALAELLNERAREQNDPTSRAQADEAVRHLMTLGRSPAELHFLARYFSERGEADEGLPYARRALELEPGCWECADTLELLRDPQAQRPPETPGPPATGRTN